MTDKIDDTRENQELVGSEGSLFFDIQEESDGFHAVLFYGLPFFRIGTGEGATPTEAFEMARADALSKIEGWRRKASDEPPHSQFLRRAHSRAWLRDRLEALLAELEEVSRKRAAACR